jgi:DNA-binding CsgD family transcriptional regulator
MLDQNVLRPLERAVLRLQKRGVSTTEIARRFHRSPAHIERVITYAGLPGRRGTDRPGLRPIERRVLAWRAVGVGHQELADRFKRSAEHMRRIEGMAHLRKARQLLA